MVLVIGQPIRLTLFGGVIKKPVCCGCLACFALIGCLWAKWKKNSLVFIIFCLIICTWKGRKTDEQEDESFGISICW